MIKQESCRQFIRPYSC